MEKYEISKILILSYASYVEPGLRSRALTDKAARISAQNGQWTVPRNSHPVVTDEKLFGVGLEALQLG